MPANFRESVRRTAAGGLYWSGASRLVQALSRHFERAQSSGGRRSFCRARGPKFAIICHHRVGSGGVPYYSNFAPDAFEAQIRFLRKAYRIVSLDELCRELDEGTEKSSQAVAITFDDGYRDVYTHAFPILRRYGVPAMVYLTASAIETGEVSWYDRIFAVVMRSRRSTLKIDGAEPKEFALPSCKSRVEMAIEIVKTLRGYSTQARSVACAALEKDADLPQAELRDRMLTWQQIREMQQAGISFGAHTMTHPPVGRLAADEYLHELEDSKRILEARLDRPVGHFAYPFGAVSDIGAESCSLLPEFGYRSAVSTVVGINTPATNRYLLRRIGGEEPSLPLFAFRLRSLFLSDQTPSREVRVLEKELELGSRKTTVDKLREDRLAT